MMINYAVITYQGVETIRYFTVKGKYVVTETQGLKVTETQKCLVCLFIHFSILRNNTSLHTILLQSNTHNKFIVLHIIILCFSTMIFFSSILFNFHIQIQISFIR